MFKWCRAALYAAFFFVACFYANPSFAQNHPPVEAFAHLPDISQPVLSPDGNHLAAVSSVNGRAAVLIFDLTAPGTRPALLPYSDGFIEAISWANNNRLLITTKKTYQRVGQYGENTWYETVAVDTQGNNGVVLINNIAAAFINTSISTISDLDLDDPDHIYMPIWYALEPGAYENGEFDYNNAHLDLFQVDVNTGKAEKFMEGSSDTYGWIMDGHGHAVARLTQSQFPLTDHLLINNGGSWKEIAHYDASGVNGSGILGLSADGKSLVRKVTTEGHDTYGLLETSLADGATKDLYINQQYDVTYDLEDPWTGRTIGYSFTADMPEYHYFDPNMEALESGLKAAFPGLSVYPVSWNLALDKVIVSVSGPRQPEEYFFLDRTTHQASLITSSYPGLTPNDLGEVKPYPYKARDGLEIPAYLTLPPGKAPKNLPVVVFPHGGPVYRDAMEFDWWAQFMANRGYAVLQPNFRGSSGYGRNFEHAGYGEWGLKMQDDITDGVKKLIADGIADPKRICIVGGSYGGYAALAGAAFTPDLYACAVSVEGVSDLTKMVTENYEGAGRGSKDVAILTQYIGDRFKDAARIAATSPVNSAEKVRIQILLMHGSKDTTVPITQSEEMRDALQSAGKKVEFIEFPNDTHYLETADTRAKMLTALEAFLDKNIGH